MDLYLADYVAGIPLLESQSAAIDLAPVEKALALVAGRLASKTLPDALRKRPKRWMPSSAPRRMPFQRSPARIVRTEALPELETALPISISGRRCLCRVASGGALAAPLLPGLRVAAGHGPVDWRRSRFLRMLACGCCGYRWRYRRTGCPFCRNEDDHRLGVIAVEDQGGLRIDYCEQCGGYLKTYQGQGSEMVLLADWTSLQLDMVALDRGLKRLAASGFDVAPLPETFLR